MVVVMEAEEVVRCYCWTRRRRLDVLAVAFVLLARRNRSVV
jgi:hypothetical protein